MSDDAADRERDDRARTARQVRIGLKWLPVARGIRFLITVLLGRFILPGRFALIDASMAVIVILNVVRESGFGAAFIQRKSKSDEDEALAADTTFVFTFCLHAVLFLLAFFAAPYIASYFRESDGSPVEDLPNVLRAMFVLFLIDGLSAAPSLVLQKRMEFGRTAVAEVLSTVAFAVLAAGFLYAGFEVWSIVWAHLGSRALEMVLYYWVSGWRPRFRFCKTIFKELLVFGKWMWGFSALSSVGGIFDRMLLGRLKGMIDLGLYGRAFNVCNMPSRQLAVVVNRIAFPALSRLQDDLDGMRRAFDKALSHVALLAVPLGFGLAAVSEEFVGTVFRSEYGPAAGIVEVLAFYGMALATSSVAGPILQAMGKPKILLYCSIVHHAILFPLVGTLWVYGPVGVAYGVLIPMLVSTVITYALVMRYLNLSLRRAVGPLVGPLAAGVAMFFGVELFQAGFASYAETL
ncbi:MAG: lipopolysaccharide biosynthesis protein, partial [Planctomycetota bacterium]